MRRLTALLALLLAVSLPFAALAEGVFPLTDEEALALFYSGTAFEPGDDFSFRYNKYLPEYGVSIPFTGYVKEARRFGSQYVVVIREKGDAHSEGYCNLSFGVYDPAQNALVGEPLTFAADWADYSLHYREGVMSVVYIGGSTWTGLEAYNGGRWEWTGAAWRMMWPYEDDRGEASYDFWNRRKAEIGYDPLGTLNTWYRMPDAGGESLSDYHWKRESTFDPFYPVESQLQYLPFE